MYQLGDIAKKLNLPESTVRTWRDQFALFIPGEGEGRARRYSEDELALFLEISHYKNQRLTVPEITKKLANRHAITVTDDLPDTTEQPDLAQLILRMAQEISTMREHIKNLEQHQEQRFDTMSRQIAGASEGIQEQLRKQAEVQRRHEEERDQEVLDQLSQWRTERAAEQVPKKRWWPFDRKP